jgi:hypothetical protein
MTTTMVKAPGERMSGACLLKFWQLPATDIILDFCSPSSQKVPDKQLRVKANLRHRPGGKNKARTKFIELCLIAKHPDRWELVKKLSQRMAEVYRIKQGLSLGTPPHSTLKL